MRAVGRQTGQPTGRLRRNDHRAGAALLKQLRVLRLAGSRNDGDVRRKAASGERGEDRGVVPAECDHDDLRIFDQCVPQDLLAGGRTDHRDEPGRGGRGTGLRIDLDHDDLVAITPLEQQLRTALRPLVPYPRTTM